MKLLKTVFVVAVLLTVGCAEEVEEVLPPPADAHGLCSASCVFLRPQDNCVLGAGVFVAKDDEGDHVFCLTARHVLTEWEYDDFKQPPYTNPLGMKVALSDGGGGVRVWHAKIAPERWRFADKVHDVAWCELSDAERKELRIAAVSVGTTAKDGICESGEEGRCGGTAVAKLREYGAAGISRGADLVLVLPEREMSKERASFGTGATTNALGKLRDASPVLVKMNFRHHCTMKGLQTPQLLAHAKLNHGDSGAPAFAMGLVGKKHYPLLVGVVTSITDDMDADGSGKPGASICPLDECVVNVIGTSLSSKRLVDFPEYQ